MTLGLIFEYLKRVKEMAVLNSVPTVWLYCWHALNLGFNFRQASADLMTYLHSDILSCQKFLNK